MRIKVIVAMQQLVAVIIAGGLLASQYGWRVGLAAFFIAWALMPAYE